MTTDSVVPYRSGTVLRSAACSHVSQRQGFTLVEMMVSVTLALLMILAVVQIFEWMGESVAFGRATIEMSGELQTATKQLQSDLDNRTCDVKPWIKPGEGAGYFYYGEGNGEDAGLPGRMQLARNDSANLIQSASTSRPNFFDPNSNLGDQNDVLALTVRSTGKPFSGFIVNHLTGASTQIESSMAEISYLVATVDGSVNLYRHVRLIVPAAVVAPAIVPPAAEFNATESDIAIDVTTGAPLSLTDLTLTGNRYHALLNNGVKIPTGSDAVGYLDAEPGDTYATAAFRLLTQSKNIVLQDVLAFDARGFDPGAQILQYNDVVLSPGDLGYVTAAQATSPAATLVGSGAFVDLGYGWNFGTTNWRYPLKAGWVRGDFAGTYQLPNGTFVNPPVYNTMSWAEIMATDEGADGLDNDSHNGVDDPGEWRENKPSGGYWSTPIQSPYEVPLRGIEVSLRIWEVQTGQVMQSSVVGDFVPK